MDNAPSAGTVPFDERLLAAIVSSASEAIIGKTPKGRITSWNAAAERLYGYSAEEAVGQHVSLIVPPQRRAELEAILARVAAGERVPEFDTVRVRKDGAQVEVAVTISPIVDDAGLVVGASTLARDIGERKRAEEALLASERRVRAMLDASLDAVIMTDAHGRVVEFNRAAEAMFGRSRAAVIDADIAGLIVPFVARMAFRDELRAFRERGDTETRGRRFEVDALRSDGTAFPVAVRVERVERDCQTQLIGYLSDLTQVRRSEESYRHLFAHHPMPIWLYDTQTLQFLEVNTAAVELYGWSREELLAMTIEGIRPEEDVVSLREALAEGFEDEPRVWRHRRKDGTLMDVEVQARSVEFEGRPARLALAQDVTRERRLEEELRQTQKMEAIGRLAGGIAHDFNNLLMVIKLAAAELGRGRSPDERASVALINDTVARATGLTRQLLAFSRMQVLRLEPTNVSELVTETHALLDRLIGEDIRVSVRTAPDLPPILADGNQLTQVILNLAVNAREAMPHGGNLMIETSETVLDEHYVDEHLDIAPGSYVLLCVTDDGVGMDERARARAFEPFFTTKDTGTGFGLATVYGIVKQCGGEVWLYSEPGLGTTFKLYFPVLPAERTVETQAPRSDVGPVTTGWETILLVEDEDTLRPIIARTLEDHGYTVLQARDAPDALRVAGELQTEIHLLVTDIVMPGLNGRELAELLSVARPRLRVLYSSGYPADTILRHGIEYATVSFIEKPYDADALLQHVRTSLRSPITER